MPARTDTVAMANAGSQMPLLACSPEYIHSTGVFGVWSLPDRSTPFKKSIEDGLDSVLSYYEQQVDDRSWYGFWQFGDFMHSYSAPRHVWHYDWGGHAWDNTELGAPLWLWYSYLRTGRADLFRLAEAHARNTSETDVYHLGPMKGLGSRHNVIKWGDGAKEARISQAAHWRFFYYLTTDERIGDIMHMVAESAGIAVGRYDPMREAEPRMPGEPAGAHPHRARLVCHCGQLDDRVGTHRRCPLARPHPGGRGFDSGDALLAGNRQAEAPFDTAVLSGGGRIRCRDRENCRRSPTRSPKSSGAGEL
jgi:hypothetical protein